MSTNVATLCRTPGTLRYQSDGPADGFNDPTDEWIEVDVLCSIQMRSRQEYDDTGQLSSTTWLAIFPLTVDPQPRSVDQLVVAGVTYEFRGDSWLALGTRGGADHIESTLMRSE